MEGQSGDGVARTGRAGSRPGGLDGELTSDGPAARDDTRYTARHRLEPQGSGRLGGWWADNAALALISLGGLVLRVALAATRTNTLEGDPLFYHQEANLVASGKGFVSPIALSYLHESVPAAGHPPLTTLWFALWSAVGLDSARWHLVAGAVIGAGAVALVAATARLVAGRRAAIIAGAVAALWPSLIYFSITAHAEAVAMTCVALFTYLAVRYLQAPSLRGLVAVGAAAALAGLARSELILLVVAVVPLAAVARPLSRSGKLRWIGASVLVAMALVAPWAIYNQTRFEKPVPLSTGLGLVVASSNCDEAYYGRAIGYWAFGCGVSAQKIARADRSADESELDLRMRAVGLRYARQHEGRLPAVVSARLGRMFGLFQPSYSVRLGVVTEGVSNAWGTAIALAWWVAMAIGALGAVQLRRRGSHLTPYIAPVVVIAVTAAISYGTARFRAPIEPAVLVLMAIALDRISRGRPAPSAEARGPESGHEGAHPSLDG